MADVLSHYTSMAGLEGIAKSGSLWASNFLSLNDTTEFLFAFTDIMKEALRALVADVPFTPVASVERAMSGIESTFRKAFEAQDVYEQLYVTSFAMGKNEDENNRGVLTLWDRYTQNKGYCLQFNKSDISDRLGLEASGFSYASLSLSPVSYGIDRAEREYLEIIDQMKMQLILFVQKARSDLRFPYKFDGMWADSVLAARFTHFCARHKDPCFVDEREFRIMAFPLNKNVVVPLRGIALKKVIKTKPTGGKYLSIGEDWRPGLSPIRIIIGPKADPNIDGILSLFHKRPKVELCNLPIA